MIGLTNGRRRVSKYGLTPRIAGLDAATATVAAADALMEFAMTLRRQEVELAKLGDANSALAGESMGCSSAAAARAAQAIVNNAEMIYNDINNVINTSGVITGRFSKTFNGTANQELTQAIADSRITVNAIGYCFYAPVAWDPYMSNFPAWEDSVVAGTVTFKIRNIAAPLATYPFKYIISP